MHHLFTFLVLSLPLIVSTSTGCATRSIDPPRGVRPKTVVMEVTGYDSGPKSCGWEYSGFLGLGGPVYAYGPNKGKPKKVGITANGAKAQMGTLAADTAHYPFGTVMYIKGYGYGIVEDRGGAIKGPNKLDLWFPSERRALQWGRQKVEVKVWVKR